MRSSTGIFGAFSTGEHLDSEETRPMPTFRYSTGSRDAEIEAMRAYPGGDSPACERIATGIAQPAARDYFEAHRGALETALAGLATVAVSARRVRRFGEEGDEIDTARVAAGDADCWSKRHRLAKRRVVRFGINLSVSSGGQTDNVFGAIAGACAAASDVLTRAGYGVEITPYSFGTDHPGKRFMAVGLLQPVKRAHELLDVERILALGDPAALTALVWGVRFATPHTSEVWGPRMQDMGNQNPRVATPAALAAIGFDYSFGAQWDHGAQAVAMCARGLSAALFGAEGAQ